MNCAGKLVLAGTPIGSRHDVSAALIALLESADLIAAEDTRQFAALTRRLDVQVTGRTMSYFEGNEESRTQQILEAITSGQTVALVTDAGMPSVSDPGYRLVRACIEEGLPVTAVPGPSAVLTALALSGLPTHRFCFEGFAPRKAGERQRMLRALADEQRTMIFFEAPHRLAAFLSDASDVFGAERQAAVCRELTKPHEEVIRDGLGALAEWASEGVRGEVTVVISGAEPRVASLTVALELVERRIAAGEKLSAAVSDVAAATGVQRKALYEAALAARKGTK